MFGKRPRTLIFRKLVSSSEWCRITYVCCVYD